MFEGQPTIVGGVTSLLIPESELAPEVPQAFVAETEIVYGPELLVQI